MARAQVYRCFGLRQWPCVAPAPLARKRRPSRLWAPSHRQEAVGAQQSLDFTEHLWVLGSVCLGAQMGAQTAILATKWAPKGWRSNAS